MKEVKRRLPDLTFNILADHFGSISLRIDGDENRNEIFIFPVESL